jgi:LysM repeat protein
MVEGNQVSNSNTVQLKVNEKTENPVTQVEKEKPSNPLQKNDNSKINSQAKGVPAATVEFTPENQPFFNHTVKPGESLSSISRKYFGDISHYKEIFKLNQSKDFPSINSSLEIGQVLKIPQKNTVAPAPAFIEKPAPVEKQTIEAKEKVKINIDLYYPEKTKDSTLVDVKVLDALKVNKSYDIHPKLLNNTNIKTEFGNWARKAADILEENKAGIIIASKTGEKYNVNSKFLNNLADVAADKNDGYLAIRHFFRDDMGLAFFNTVWAIDDIATNLKTDPYFTEFKEENKVFDLASVAKIYHLDNDKADYLGGLREHGHRGIPVHIETPIIGSLIEVKSSATAKEMINNLAKSFDSQGNLTDGNDFEKKVFEILDNKDNRKILIEHFKLNSKENLDSLIPAITGESGAAPTERDYNSYLCVGSVMLNRTLGRNLKKYAKATAQEIPETKIKPVPVKSILMEDGQFAITWAKVGDTETSIFNFQTSLNNKYKLGKLKEGGNSFESFKLANEVVTDLYSGIHNLKADLNGESTKEAGRNTSDLFYFNQSHNDDFSGKNAEAAAVKIIDNNNTQVFFKAWDGHAFFRYD